MATRLLCTLNNEVDENIFREYKLSFTEASVSFDTTKVSNSEQSGFLKSTVEDKSEIRLQDAGGSANAPSPPCNQITPFIISHSCSSDIKKANSLEISQLS